MRLLSIQLICILSVWVIWYLNTGASKIVELIESHIAIMLTMVLGSFVAGSTSLGGGAVAFPVFTKLLSVPSNTALIFSLAIQSVGMSAAMLIIFLSKVPVNVRIILLSILPGSLGVYIGLFELNHLFSGGQAKYLFSLFSLCVAFVLIFDRFINQREFKSNLKRNAKDSIGFLAVVIGSFVGGIVTGLIGTGIDFVIFALMIIFTRTGLKIAVATSVCVMALNAIAGFIFVLLLSDRFSGVVIDYWLSAVPIVVVGAPLGALACKFFHRDVVFYFLMLLILLDVVSTAWILDKHIHFISISILGVVGLVWWYNNQRKVV